jgi:hypothetical protein
MDSSITGGLSILLSDLIQRKPTTSADAVALLEKADMVLTMWIISDLPVSEQKAILVSKWSAKEVEQVSSSCCTPNPKKKKLPEPFFLGIHQ